MSTCEFTIIGNDHLINRLNEIISEKDKRIADLEAQLEAAKLKWQTGKPPKDGWYWNKIQRSDETWTEPNVVYFELEYYSPSLTYFNFREWAGPIAEPEE